MSRQTLDDLFEKYCLGDTTHVGESAYDTDKLIPATKALIRQEQLSLLKRLMKEKRRGFADNPNTEVVLVSAIESELRKLSQPTEGDRS